MRALKITLAVLGGIIVLTIVAAIIFINTFDPNSLKDELTAAVQERTGRTLEIADSIELSLFPWFAVETGGLTLSDDPAYGDRNLISIDELSARVRVWPLLRRRVEIGKVILDGIHLNVGVDADGRGNWESLLEYGRTGAGDPAAAATDERRPFEQLAVEGIELRNARILWHDASGEVRWLVRDLDLETGTIRDDEPVRLTLALSLLDVATQNTFELEFATNAQRVPELRLRDVSAAVRMLDSREQERARADLDAGSIAYAGEVLRTSPLTVTAVLTQPPVGPESLQTDISLASLELDTAAGSLVVVGLSTRTGQIAADWNLSGDDLLGAARIQGNVSLRAESLAALFATLGIEQPGELGAAAREPFTGSTEFAFALDPRAVTLGNLRLAAAGIQATGNASLAADSALSGRFDVPAFSLAGPALATLQAFMPEGIDLDGADRASAAGGFRLSGAGDRLELTNLSIGLDAASLTGNLTLAGPADAREAFGNLSLTGLNNPLLAGLATGLLPESLIEAELGQFRLVTDFSHDYAAGLTELNPIQITAYGLSGEGQLTMRRTGDDLALSGQARLAPFNPRALLGRFDQPVPASADPNVLRTATLAATFETTGNDGRFRDIAIDLDDSRITGEFSVEDFANPSYRFVLRADRIDVDRYLPPTADAGDSPNDADRKLGDIELASEPLTATVVQGSASVGSLIIGGLQYEQLSANLAVGGGHASLSSVQTELYGGQFSGGVSIDTAGAKPAIHLTGDATNIAVRPLLSDMLGSAHISGIGNVSVDLRGTGDTIGEAMQSAAGRLQLALRDGEIAGINVGLELCEAANQLRELPEPPAAPAVTAFSVIRASASVQEGIASTNDLTAVTGFLELTGRGNIRLVDQWINVQNEAQLKGSLTLPGCERLNAIIQNDPVPITFGLEGKLPDVELRFTGDDARRLGAELVRREARQRADQELEDVRERLQQSVIDRLLN